MHLSTVRFIFVLCFVAVFCIEHASAQKTEQEMQDELEETLNKDSELYKKFKSSEAFKELQKKIDELSTPPTTVNLQFKLYQKSATGLTDITDLVDDVFINIEKYQCGTYGDNPSKILTDKQLGQYALELRFWAPSCVQVEVYSSKLEYNGYTEWDPSQSLQGQTKVVSQQKYNLSDNYTLEVGSMWKRNTSAKKENYESGFEPSPSTVIGTLSQWVSDDSGTYNVKPVPHSEIHVPGMDITAESDRHGNFVLRDLPAGKVLQLIAKKSKSTAPDTLRFVAAPNRIVDMGQMILNINDF